MLMAKTTHFFTMSRNLIMCTNKITGTKRQHKHIMYTVIVKIRVLYLLFVRSHCRANTDE